MRFPRSLALLPLSLAVALPATPSRAQTTDEGKPTFPDLQKLQEDLQQRSPNPIFAPPSMGPFGEQPYVPVPPEHPNPPPEAPSPWLITPQVQLSETVTDNAALSHSDRQTDLETFFNPSLALTGDTRLAKVDLNYSPVFLRNVVDTSNNRFDQNFFGTGTLTAVPDALFVNARASASEGSRSGSFGSIDPVNIRIADRTEVLAYDAGPEWRFPIPLDDGATGDVRYLIGQTRFYDNTGAALSDSNGQPLVSSDISNGTLQDFRLYLDSGDRGNRLAAQFTAEGVRDRIANGGGTDDTGTVLVESQVRLTPVIQLLGSAGYEDLRYSAFSFADVHDPTWYGGVRWRNAKDSYAELTYGHRQGVDSFAGRLHYPLTPLTSAFAEYGETVTTPQQQILDNLNRGQLTPSSVVVNPQTGAPELLLVNELTLQNSIYRDRAFRAGVVTVNEPNLYAIDVSYEDYIPIAGTLTQDSYVGVEGIWQHAMNETTSFTLNGGWYGRQQLNESTYDLQASIGRYLTPSLLGSIGYQFIYGGSNLSSRQFYRNAITAYLRKTF